MIECKNCKTHFKGQYCSHCGQKVYSDKDKSLKHIFEEVFHFFTHFEGTFMTTLKAVLIHPGQLSLDYCNGIRKKYYKPVSFYFLLVIMYLLFPVLKGLNQEIEMMETNNFGGQMIVAQVQKKMQEEHIAEAVLFEHYHDKSQTVSKFLLFLLIPFAALVLFLLHARQKKYAFDYFILATEINIFFLLTSFLLLPVLIAVFSFVFGFQDVSDNVIFSISILSMITFLILFFHKTLKDRWPIALIKGSAFLFFFFVFTFMIYRFIVFEVTMLLI